MKSCLFAGSFDPFTKGHKAVVERALEDFDVVYVAIGINVTKKNYFSKEERLEIIKKSLEDIDPKKIVVDSFDGYLVDYLKEKNIYANIRGIRNDKDLAYESRMAEVNKGLYPSLRTVFYHDIAGYEGISSTKSREHLLSKRANYFEICESAKETVKKILKTKKK